MENQETNNVVNEAEAVAVEEPISSEIIVNNSSSIKSLEDFEKEIALLEKEEAKKNQSSDVAPEETVSAQTSTENAESKQEIVSNETTSDIPNKTVSEEAVSSQTPTENAESKQEIVSNETTTDTPNEVVPEETISAQTPTENAESKQEIVSNETTTDIQNEEAPLETHDVVDSENLLEIAIASSEKDNQNIVNDANAMTNLMSAVLNDHLNIDENSNEESSDTNKQNDELVIDESVDNKESTTTTEENNDNKESKTNIEEHNDSKESKDSADNSDLSDMEEIAKISKIEKEKSKSSIIGKNVRNLISKIEKIKKMEIQDLIDILYCGKKYTGLEKKIVNKFIDEYITLKYYNIHEFKGYDNYCANIRVRLLDYAKKLYDQSKSIEERNLVIRVTDIFLLLNLLDNEEKFDINTRMLDSKRLVFKNKVTIVKDILKVFKYYDGLYDGFLKKIKSTVFTLSIKQVDKDVELYNTNVCSNIQFNEMFNREIVVKTYNEEVILENLREVQLRLLSARIADEMLTLNHGKKYIISFPTTLYDKEKKLKSFLTCMDDIYSQSKIYILIGPEILNKKYKQITQLKKDGYRFVVELYASYLDVIKDLKLLFVVCDYVIIVGYEKNKKELSALLPSYLVDKVIYSDTSMNNGVIC